MACLFEKSYFIFNENIAQIFNKKKFKEILKES